MIRSNYGSKLFDFLNYIFLALIALTTLYPFWDALIISITPLEESLATAFHLYPKKLSFEAYQYLLKMGQLWKSYGVTIIITGLGTAISMIATTLVAYALSKNDLPGVRIIMFIIVFTMMFSGGLIPTYIVVRQVGIMNTIWSMMIPNAIATYNLIIMRTFFQSIPQSLEESARIDGCNDFGILLRIVIPLSKPVIFTIALFYAVTRWNDFFTAVMYVTDRDLWPLQLFLRSMLIESESAFQSGGDNPLLLGQSIKMAAVMVSTIPVIMLYPFFQKHFIQGITLGSVKE